MMQKATCLTHFIYYGVVVRECVEIYTWLIHSPGKLQKQIISKPEFRLFVGGGLQ